MSKPFFLSVALGFVCLNVFPQSVIVNSNPTMNDRFSKRSGNLRLSTTLLKIGKIKNNATRTDTIFLYNDGAGKMNLAIGKVPEHISVKIGTASLASKKEGWIAVSYHAEKKNDYGYVLDRFDILTNDSIQPKKSIGVVAHIQEYFSPMSADDSLNVQRAKWGETTYEYGKIKQGTKVTHSFSLTNEGKRDLIIRKIKTNCSCLKLSAGTDSISPGATVNFNVEFDSANKEGTDSRKMNVFLNDPSKPEVVLELKGEIEK